MLRNKQNAVGAMFAMGFMGMGGDEKAKVEAIFKEHGIATGPEGKEVDMVTVLEKIDCKAFLIDAYEYLAEHGDSKARDPGSVEDVEIDGDTATATIVREIASGATKKQKVAFRKVDGGWLIDARPK